MPLREADAACLKLGKAKCHIIILLFLGVSYIPAVHLFNIPSVMGSEDCSENIWGCSYEFIGVKWKSLKSFQAVKTQHTVIIETHTHTPVHTCAGRKEMLNLNN